MQDHLFRDCWFSKRIWKPCPLGISLINSTPIPPLAQWCKNFLLLFVGEGPHSHRWRISFVVLLGIKLHRNEISFNRTGLCPRRVKDIFEDSLSRTCKAFTQMEGVIMEQNVGRLEPLQSIFCHGPPFAIPKYTINLGRA